MSAVHPLRRFLGLLLLVAFYGSCRCGAQGQSAKENLAKFDYRSYHFGFLLSGNSSSFNFQPAPRLHLCRQPLERRKQRALRV